MRLLNSGFSNLTDEDFFDKGTFIVAQLMGNAYYPTTNPTLAAVQLRGVAWRLGERIGPAIWLEANWSG